MSVILYLNGTPAERGNSYPVYYLKGSYFFFAVCPFGLG